MLLNSPKLRNFIAAFTYKKIKRPIVLTLFTQKQQKILANIKP